MAKRKDYRDRAKALCEEAGLNPLELVERPGLPAAPRWIGYLSAAQDEAKIGDKKPFVMPQPDEYKDMHLEIVGDHDQKTIDQMRDCMKVGNTVGGAICADGHLGYAQPVGGVIAYEKQISISGVGFDIACFTGDTKVFCLDGENRDIKSLVDKNIWVLSCNEDGKIVPSKARGIKTGTKPIIEVTLDNNEIVRCTADHKFMLRDGSYTEANKLTVGSSLMPFYKITDRDGYIRVREQDNRSYPKRLNRMAYESLHGTIDAGHDIHHVNHIKTDNSPENLLSVDKSYHAKNHILSRDMSYTKTDSYENNRINGISKYWENISYDDLEKKKVTVVNNFIEFRKNNPTWKESYKNNGSHGREHLIKYNSSMERRENVNKLKGRKYKCGECGELCPYSNSIKSHYKNNHVDIYNTLENDGDNRTSFKRKVEKLYYNHKVIKIEATNVVEDVYCLEVPGLNNFALSAGIFVHNCGNMAIKLDTTFGDIKYRLPQIRDDISRIISFGVGRTNEEKVEAELFDDAEAWKSSDMNSYKTKAVNQLGTVGSGNHYVDILVDRTDIVSDNLDDMDDRNVWIGVHFGSRGFGHSTATRWLKAAGGIDGMNVPPTVVNEDSEIGERYIAGMTLAGRYAYAGREWVCERVRKIIGGNVLTTVHNHHNYCIPEDGIISTTTGPKKMKDIVSGDMVYSINDGKIIETKVLDKWESGIKKIYKISTRNRSIRCSGDHPIQVYDKKTSSCVWKVASLIDYNDEIVCAKCYYNNSDMNLYDEGVYRFIGAYIGDGWIKSKTDNGYAIGLAIGNSKEKHTYRYKELLEYISENIVEKTITTGPKSQWRIKDTGNYGINTSNKDFYKFILHLGIGEKSTKRRIPKFVFSSSRENRIALLSGYVDADGSVSKNIKNKGRTTFCSVNKELIEDLRELAISCGMMVTNISTYNGDGYCKYTAYRFNLNQRSSSMLNLWHENKNNRIVHNSPTTKEENIFYQKVKNIVIEEEETVYDITVEDSSHSFICDGVVVHNCWRENHNGKDCWVVRKGATPAFPGQLGFVGGSMGDDAVIVEGIDSEKSKRQLYSTVHGAGRLFGRRQAIKTFKREDMEKWLNDRGVLLSGADLDESPMAYRRLNDVIGHHAGTVKVNSVLRPVIVAMAGKDTFDPWKD